MFKIISLIIQILSLSVYLSLGHAAVGDIVELPDGSCGEVSREQTAGQGENCADPLPIPELPPGVTCSKELIKVTDYITWSHCVYRIIFQWTYPVLCPPP
ncbi:hypothetical protein, partial [Desulfogranum mediterraneum]|uniref:hypothetical protein n=1 Tax=Desulfogranum mediterraneum TaxID=160661 RepID=UPI001ABF0C33